jgi:hypothetical protein
LEKRVSVKEIDLDRESSFRHMASFGSFGANRDQVHSAAAILSFRRHRLRLDSAHPFSGLATRLLRSRKQPLEAAKSGHAGERPGRAH